MIVSAPALLLGLLFFGCSRKEEASPPSPPAAVAPEMKVLATVNGDPITLGEFQERFARAGLKPEKEAELQVKEEFLNRCIRLAVQHIYLPIELNQAVFVIVE